MLKNRHHADVERMRKYGGMEVAQPASTLLREYSIHLVIQALDMYFVQEDMYKDARIMP